jgi:nicotinamidase/pyrazinamidase
LYPAGALYVPGAEQIVGRVAELNKYAAEHGIAVVSTMDAHTEDDPEFRDWPPHCITGTAGQHKPASTLLEKRVVVRNVVPNAVPNAASSVEVNSAEQIILEKQSTNCFENPNLLRVLDELQADRCIVYGVVTEICVRHAALGLLKSGRRVELVTDAVCSLDESECAKFLAEFKGAGGELTTLDQVTSL